MADIIQLKEKGVNKYVMTTTEAVKGLKKITETKVYKVNYATGFRDYSDNQPLEISVVNGRAIISGVFTNNSKIVSGAIVSVGTVPKNCVPRKNAISPRLQGTGGHTYVLQIDTGGVVSLMRYRYGTTDDDVAANSYLTVNMSYDTVVESEEA